MPTAVDILTRHKAALAVAGIVLLLVGAWTGATAYASPITTRSTVETGSWSESASFSYAVPVTRNSTHWPVGTVLPMGQPAYFRTVSDSILVQHTWTPRVPEGARGIAASTMVVRVVGEDKAGRPFWTIEHPLAEASTQDIAGGLFLSGVVDLDALVDETSRIGLELPVGDGVLNWSVRTHVVYAIAVDGHDETGESDHILPIIASDPRFMLPAPDALMRETPHVRTQAIETTSIAGAPGVLRSLGTLGALALGALLVVAAGVASVRATRNEGFDREYRRYREWVSVAGGIPDAARDPATMVDVGSLEDLVHVASDARTRVLLDAQTREFFALLPGVTYRYARHAVAALPG